MNEVVKGVALDALGEPHESLGGMLEIRFTNKDGVTEVWMVPNKPYGQDGVEILASLRREGVKLAFLDSGVDSRIGLLSQQAETARDHIGKHHDELREFFRREYGADYHCQFYVPKEEPSGAPDA